MIAYGLLIPAGDYCVGMLMPYMEAWGSLLTEDERNALDRENKRLNQLYGY